MSARRFKVRSRRRNGVNQREIERARAGADLGFEAKASKLRESDMSDVPRIHSEAAEQEEMAKLIWRITGYLGDKSIYERAVRKGALSQKAMIALLQRLASRHLSEDEVVSSSLKKDDRDYCSALKFVAAVEMH